MRRLAICILPLISACYTYAPIEPGRVQPGTGVRARISPAAAEQLSLLIGTPTGRVLSGRLVSSSSDTMIVEVPSVMQASTGGSVETLHQRVAIARADLVELETRRLDRLRTTAVVGGIAVAVATIVITALDKDPGSGGLSGNGGGPDARLPVGGVRF